MKKNKLFLLHNKISNLSSFDDNELFLLRIKIQIQMERNIKMSKISNFGKKHGAHRFIRTLLMTKPQPIGDRNTRFV